MSLIYAEAFPEQIEAAWARHAPAILPIGALEWHGPHLPLGLDGIVADAFCRRLADALDGVLLPCLWTPVTTLPHPASLQVSTTTFRALIDDTLEALSDAECVFLVTGHYAQGHVIELYDAAERTMTRRPGCRVLAGSPLELLGDEALLDHAGWAEAAQLLALRPDLVRLKALPKEHTPQHHAVLGRSPHDASAEDGEGLISRAVDAWRAWYAENSPDLLAAHYAERRAAYDDYRRRFYKTSWEQAIADWWAAK